MAKKKSGTAAAEVNPPTDGAGAPTVPATTKAPKAAKATAKAPSKIQTKVYSFPVF